MTSQSRNGLGCIIGFGLFWCLIVGIFDVMVFPGLCKQAQSSTYIPAEATVLESRVIEEEGDDSTSYRPYLRYEYQVGGRTLVNDRYRAGMNISFGSRAAEQVVNSHPVGSKMEVFYPAGHPDQAIVQKGLTGPDLFLPMFLTPFNLIGLVLLLAPLLGRLQSGPGGIPLVREGLGWRARLNYTHPLVAAGLGLGAASFFGVFVVAFGTGMNPGLLTMQIAWTVVLAIALQAGYKTWQRNLEIGTDLRVEPGRLEFASAGQRIACRFDEVSEVGLRTEEKRDSDGDLRSSYALDLQLRSGACHTLKVWNCQDQAQQFLAWLKERMQ